MKIVITPTAAVLTHVKFMLSRAGPTSQMRFPSLPTLLKIYQYWNEGIFSSLLFLIGTFVKSHHPLSFPIQAIMAELLLENVNYRGMSIFKILYIFLVNCIQNFEMKHKEKGAHTLSHTGSQISGYWACVIIPLLSMVLYSAHREDKLEIPPWTSISFDFMITIFSLATQEKNNIQTVIIMRQNSPLLQLLITSLVSLPL